MRDLHKGETYIYIQSRKHGYRHRHQVAGTETSPSRQVSWGSMVIGWEEGRSAVVLPE